MFQLLIYSREPFFSLGMRNSIAQWDEFNLVHELAEELQLSRHLIDLTEPIDVFLIHEPTVEGSIHLLDIIQLHQPAARVCLICDHVPVPSTSALALGAFACLPSSFTLEALRSTLNMVALALASDQEGKDAAGPLILTDLPGAVLSGRELEVLKLVAAGSKNQQIAVKLCISLATVKAHVRNILRKMNAQDRTQAAVQAQKSGWL